MSKVLPPERNDAEPISQAEIVEQLSSRLAALESEVKTLRGKGGGEVEQEEELDDAVKTPYGYCIATLLSYDSPVHARLVGVLLQLGVFFLQTTLAYAFLDCSLLFWVEGVYSNTGASIDNQYKYPPAMRNEGGNPYITVYTGLLAAVVLGLNLRAASDGVVLSAYPIEHLLFRAKRPPSLPKAIGYGLGIVFAQFMWMTRLCIIPLFIACGSVFLWNSENTATDIVKDSTVAVYLLDFDTMFYAVIPTYYRRKFEDNPGPAVAAGRNAAPAVMDIYKWAYWAIISWLMMSLLGGNYAANGAAGSKFFWFKRFMEESSITYEINSAIPGAPSIDAPSVAFMVQINLILNTVHALVNAYFVWTSDEHIHGLYGALATRLPSDRAKVGLKVVMILLCMGTMFAMAFLPNFIFDAYVANYGFDGAKFVTPGTTFYHCLQEFGVGEFCATADLDADWIAPPTPPPS